MERPDDRASFRIGAWTAYPDLNRLVGTERTVNIEGKVMRVLVELAKRRGQVVSKNALLDAVWPNQQVADGVLTRAIHELRVALSDQAQQSRFIETVPRRGYRLKPQPAATPIHRRWIALAGTVLLIVALTTFRFVSREDDPRPPELATRSSVAVLPFANLTGSPEKKLRR